MIRALVASVLLVAACGGGTTAPRAPQEPVVRTDATAPAPPVEPPAPTPAPSPPAPPPPSAGATALVAWLEAAATVPPGRCAAVATALAEHARQHGPRPATSDALMLEIDRTEALKTRHRAALQRILDVTMPCRHDRTVRAARDALLPGN